MAHSFLTASFKIFFSVWFSEFAYVLFKSVVAYPVWCAQDQQIYFEEWSELKW